VPEKGTNESLDILLEEAKEFYSKKEYSKASECFKKAIDGNAFLNGDKYGRYGHSLLETG